MGKVEVEVEPWANAIDAAARGRRRTKLALNVGAIADRLHRPHRARQRGAAEGRALRFAEAHAEWLIGWVGAPLAGSWGRLVRRTASASCRHATGQRFVGYVELQKMIEAGFHRAQIVYALCGFSNLSSIAIQIGGIGGIAPSEDLARLGLRDDRRLAACFQTATIAGILL